MSARPLRVRLDKPNRLLILDWDDGTRNSYPWAFLRAKCPSATERAAREAAEKNPLQVLAQVPSSDIVQLHPVGNYAINLTWSDGHAAGIYTWTYLQQIADDPQVRTEGIA